MSNQATQQATVLEIKNIPTKLILYAIEQWMYCGKYARATGCGNNTNNFIKAISVWILLKHETSSGCLHSYRHQLQALAQKCKMSVRTLEKYINWLRTEGLCFVDEEQNLLLHNYNVLRKYDIDISEKEPPILYDTTNKTRLAEILISVGLQRMKDERFVMYWKKISQNPDVLTTLSDLLIHFGADKARLHADIQYFRECHQELLCQTFEEEKPGQELYEFLHKQIDANPDLNARQSTYGRKMGYTIYEKQNKRTKKDESLCMGFSHLIKRLEAKGLVSALQDNVEGFKRARKDERIFHHRWLKQFSHTIWFRCNQLTIHLPRILKMKPDAKQAA